MNAPTTPPFVHEGRVQIVTSSVELETPGNGHVAGLTEAISDRLTESGLRAGTLTVFVPGATGAVTTVEFEPGVVADLQRVLDDIVPPDAHYRHNDNLGDGNGHSHVRAGLLGPSLTVPFVDGRLTLGRWQEIVFCDFDVRSRSRHLVLQLTGV
jgi:secondary thiamine-phosphate synthase enzyme